MKISINGLNLIKKFEGLRLTAYKPVSAEKFYTIGYGHYGSFEIKDQQLIAAIGNWTFVFEIKDKHTLILTEEGDTSYDVPYNSEFLFSEGLR